jgi:aminopeptidase-like protein
MTEHTKNIIETLTPMNRCLLGEGYDNSLKFIDHLIPLQILEFPSGTQLGTWTVPEEWIVRDAWVKGPDGEKIADYKKNPLSLVVGSIPQVAHMELRTLRKHWHYSDESPDTTPYVFKYYDNTWGFCFPKDVLYDKDENGLKDKLPEGDYEVFIDSEYKPGIMKLGVHTIKGKSDREILLFAHLDHPFQANDNLSGVACLVDLATKLKVEHTVKIIFCPETIGSVAYALTQDLSKVDFMIALDICGNTNSILMQKSFDAENKINRVAHLAIHSFAETYRKGAFRNTIGSDEYAFNDPQIGVPGIMLSTHPYKEYHTDQDTPEKIDYEQIEKMGKIIEKIIEIWEKDYIPVKKFKGQLMRSKYGIQTSSPQVNLSWDYFIYNMDGKKTLAELCTEYGLNFDYCYDVMEKIAEDKIIRKRSI